MADISKEQAAERYYKLPDNLKRAIISEKSTNIIWEVGEENHLNEQTIRKLAGLVGRVFLGFLHLEDLAGELQEKLEIDKRVAATLSEQLSRKLLRPALSNPELFHDPEPPEPEIFRNPELLETEDESLSSLLMPAFKVQPGSSGPIAPASTSVPKFEVPGDSEVDLSQTPPPPPQEPTQETPPAPPVEPLAPTQPPPPAPPSAEPQMPPTPEPPQKTQDPAPFIIHEEEGLEPLASGENAPLSRPHFFKSTAGGGGEDEAVAARLEIGEVEEEQVGPEVGRTEKEDIRVVNYESPDIKVNPFSRQNAAPPAPTPPAKEKSIKDELKDVSENNIVNLKDLPK